MNDKLYWDDSYAIALALMHDHPGTNLETVSLEMVFEWVIALPAFGDDVELANDEILEDIYKVWLEESL